MNNLGVQKYRRTAVVVFSSENMVLDILDLWIDEGRITDDDVFDIMIDKDGDLHKKAWSEAVKSYWGK